jgi:hypothetical protein
VKCSSDICGFDLTGVFCTRQSKREFTWRRTGHAYEEIQAGADREFVAAD